MFSDMNAWTVLQLEVEHKPAEGRLRTPFAAA